MKIFAALLILAVLLLVGGYFLFSGGGEPERQPGKAQAAAQAEAARPKQDFHALTALLEKDRAAIPATLEAPRALPENAFKLKSRLAPVLETHPEYQTLTQACDLLIYADQQRSVLQRQAQAEPVRARAEWNDYRAKTDAEVRRLLASLQNKAL